MTGLALLAFLSAGHTPDVGRYGMVVRGAADYLVRQTPPDGYIGKIDDSRMYGQGIVALALAQAYGVQPVAEKRLAMRKSLERLVTVIIAAQSVKKPEALAGGWRYTPTAEDSDLCVTAWNALALLAAREAGLPVKQAAVHRATGFVERCYQPDQKTFGYQPGAAGSISMTGTGLLCLAFSPTATAPT